MSNESKQDVAGAIKWVCIALVVIVLAGVAYKAYKVVTKPAEIAGDVAENVSDVVKTGAGAVKDKTNAVLNRLDVPIANQKQFNALAESSFKTLTSMTETKPDGMKDRLFRRQNLPGHEGKVCVLSMNFGDGDLPIYVAADNKSYAKAKALGARKERLMRIVIRVEKDEIGFVLPWDEEVMGWTPKWKATTIKKPVGDDIAERRIIDVLTAANTGCK